MADVVLFVPKAEIDAEHNLSQFVEMCRTQLTVFGKDLPFEDVSWDVTEAMRLKGMGKKRTRVVFSTMATASSSKQIPMSKRFSPLAKGYIRYMHGLRPTKNIAGRVAALRAVDAALSEGGAGLLSKQLDSSVFNRAAQLIQSGFAEASAYRIGGQLEMFADFLATNRLTAIPLQWRNPIRRPRDGSRVGKEFDERRATKMPSAAALEALPKVFQLAVEPSEIIVSSVAAILCSAPDRINEVLLLPEDCEVRTKSKDGTDVYGLRWWPAKGAEPMVKWITPSMADVVADAIARIRESTREARVVAKWYESHPNNLFLPEHLEGLRTQEWLTASEVREVIYGGNALKDAGSVWCRLNGVPFKKVGHQTVFSFSGLEKAILARMPTDFPTLNMETGLTYGNALLLIRPNEFHSKKGTLTCLIEPVAIRHISDGLGARVAQGFQSIFSKFGFAEPDGSPIKVTTHQFRHYLNTLAQAGGMSQLDIAKWSGRKDIRQNAVYDHVSADELVLKIRNALGDDRQMYGPLAELPKRVVISRDEFARLKVPTAHPTEFGVCIRDYTMAPCQLHADCINCNEQVCIKGDEVRTARLHAELEAAKENLEAARQAHGEGDFGASRWVDHHLLTVERLTQLCAILDDPKVPVGAVIQLSNLPVTSRIEQAAEERAAALGHKEIEPAPSNTSMAAMRNMLAGMEA